MASTEEIICMTKKSAAKESAYQRKSRVAKLLRYGLGRIDLIGEKLERNAVSGPVGSQFDSGLDISLTITFASDGRKSSVARRVKPIPKPPTNTEGCSSVRARRQANVARASSEPCMRLDIRLLPLASMMYSVSRRTSFMSVPSGVSVSPSNSRGFTCVISQEWETYVNLESGK